MTIPIERRLVSAQLRLLLQRYLAEGLEGEDLDAFDALLVQLADGDVWQSAEALNDLVLKLRQRDPAQGAILDFFFDGHLDLVAVRDGTFAWGASTGFKEAYD